MICHDLFRLGIISTNELVMTLHIEMGYFYLLLPSEFVLWDCVVESRALVEISVVTC